MFTGNDSFADQVYFNGYIYTADTNNTIHHAIAIKDGRIIAVGSDEEIRSTISDQTKCFDLQGKMMMPGIVDAHLHTFWGGGQLSDFSLKYESLSVGQILERFQKHVDSYSLQSDEDWLVVRAWVRSNMIPAGTDITRFDLDRIKTERPIMIFSNDCHTLVCNSRAMVLLDIHENTPVPPDGKIQKDHHGRLNGILEDAVAMRAFDKVQNITAQKGEKIAAIAQRELNRQGVTTILDARATEQQFHAFTALQKKGLLSIRLRSAFEITPDDVPTPHHAAQAVAMAAEIMRHYHQSEWTPVPGIAVCNIKLFVDGVLQAPLMTAALLEPYRKNYGSPAKPDWCETENYISP